MARKSRSSRNVENPTKAAFKTENYTIKQTDLTSVWSYSIVGVLAAAFLVVLIAPVGIGQFIPPTSKAKVDRAVMIANLGSRVIKTNYLLVPTTSTTDAAETEYAFYIGNTNRWVIAGFNAVVALFLFARLLYSFFMGNSKRPFEMGAAGKVRTRASWSASAAMRCITAAAMNMGVVASFVLAVLFYTNEPFQDGASILGLVAWAVIVFFNTGIFGVVFGDDVFGDGAKTVENAATPSDGAASTDRRYYISPVHMTQGWSVAAGTFAWVAIYKWHRAETVIMPFLITAIVFVSVALAATLYLSLARNVRYSNSGFLMTTWISSVAVGAAVMALLITSASIIYDSHSPTLHVTPASASAGPMTFKAATDFHFSKGIEITYLVLIVALGTVDYLARWRDSYRVGGQSTVPLAIGISILAFIYAMLGNGQQTIDLTGSVPTDKFNVVRNLMINDGYDTRFAWTVIGIFAFLLTWYTVTAGKYIQSYAKAQEQKNTNERERRANEGLDAQGKKDKKKKLLRTFLEISAATWTILVTGGSLVLALLFMVIDVTDGLRIPSRFSAFFGMGCALLTMALSMLTMFLTMGANELFISGNKSLEDLRAIVKRYTDSDGNFDANGSEEAESAQYHLGAYYDERSMIARLKLWMRNIEQLARGCFVVLIMSLFLDAFGATHMLGGHEYHNVRNCTFALIGVLLNMAAVVGTARKNDLSPTNNDRDAPNIRSESIATVTSIVACAKYAAVCLFSLVLSGAATGLLIRAFATLACFITISCSFLGNVAIARAYKGKVVPKKHRSNNMFVMGAICVCLVAVTCIASAMMGSPDTFSNEKMNGALSNCSAGMGVDDRCVPTQKWYYDVSGVGNGPDVLFAEFGFNMGIRPWILLFSISTIVFMHLSCMFSSNKWIHPRLEGGGHDYAAEEAMTMHEKQNIRFAISIPFKGLVFCFFVLLAYASTLYQSRQFGRETRALDNTNAVITLLACLCMSIMYIIFSSDMSAAAASGYKELKGQDGNAAEMDRMEAAGNRGSAHTTGGFYA